jgi:GNAT superfamily N-acetyltransferase
MNALSVNITEYNNIRDRDQVILIWTKVFGYEADHNDPGLAIDKKLQVSDGLFFVALHKDNAIGTIMAGYDGHRGWIYSLAVLPEYQKSGVGSLLLKYAENALTKLGCMKINLQILEENRTVDKFYLNNGYTTEKRISMSKIIRKNIKK